MARKKNSPGPVQTKPATPAQVKPPVTAQSKPPASSQKKPPAQPKVSRAEAAEIKKKIRTDIRTATASLDDLIKKTNATLAELENINPADVAAKAKATIEAYKAEGEALEAEAMAAEKEAETALAAAIEAGIISYSEAPSGVKNIINDLPGYRDAGVAAAISALRAVGVEGLVDVMQEIRSIYPDISSDDALTLLRFDPRFNSQYMKRFAGNKMLMDAGFAPLDDKEYLSNERAYTDIFSAYDLPQFNSRDRFARLIGGRVSPEALAARVSLAADRVLKGATETRQALQQFYPELTNSDLIAYAIDPVNQLPALQRKVQAAELGGAALAQGLTASLKTAPTEKSMYTNVRREGLSTEELMAQGITLPEARKGYAAVAEVLPTAEKLSAIYGGRLEQFGRKQAEEEQFKQLASAKRAKKALSEAEIAAFSGESGRGATSLTRERFV